VNCVKIEAKSQNFSAASYKKATGACFALCELNYLAMGVVVPSLAAYQNEADLLQNATISLSAERLTVLAEPLKQKLHRLGVSEAQINHVIKPGKLDPSHEAPCAHSAKNRRARCVEQ